LGQAASSGKERKSIGVLEVRGAERKSFQGVQINAEIATGSGAGMEKAIVLQGSERGLKKGSAYVNRELLRGDAGTKGAAGKAGVGGAVRDAEFPAGDGKFRGPGKCPHGWVDWMTCRNNKGGCE
jgi:hypothetical protein